MSLSVDKRPIAISISNDEFLALVQSEQKWQAIMDLKSPDLGTENCPLCLFHANNCSQCVICRVSGEEECRNTPYFEFYDKSVDEDLSLIITRPRINGFGCTEKSWVLGYGSWLAAKAERDFIRSIIARCEVI
jgi:hypothetical protein